MRLPASLSLIRRPSFRVGPRRKIRCRCHLFVSFLIEQVYENGVELRGFEPLTSCMPDKSLPSRNVAACGSTSGFNRWTSPVITPHRRLLAPRLAPRPTCHARPSAAPDPNRTRCRIILLAQHVAPEATDRHSSGKDRALSPAARPDRTWRRASPRRYLYK